MAGKTDPLAAMRARFEALGYDGDKMINLMRDPAWRAAFNAAGDPADIRPPPDRGPLMPDTPDDWTPEREQAIRERCERATPGPWEASYAYNNGGMPTGDFKIPGHNGGATVEMLVDDAYFCAHARKDLPAALDEIERLTAELAARAPVDCDHRAGGEASIAGTCADCGVDFADLPDATADRSTPASPIPWSVAVDIAKALCAEGSIARQAATVIRIASRGETGPAPTWGEQAIAEHRRAAADLGPGISGAPIRVRPPAGRRASLEAALHDPETAEGAAAILADMPPDPLALDPEDGTLCADCRAPRNTIHGALCSVRAGAKPGRVPDPRATLHAGDPERPDPRVDYSDGMRPAVLGGECAECLHAPPLHERTCSKLARRPQ